MKEFYLINNKKYKLKDFTFKEHETVTKLRSELEYSGNAINISNDKLLELLNFILITENNEAALITESDKDNTGMREISELILDFLTYEIQFAVEKKRYLERSLKELK